MTAKPLTSEQISIFEADGVICLRGIVDHAWLERLWRSSDEAMTLQPTDAGLAYFKRIRLWQQIPALGEFCHRSILPRIAASLLKASKVNLLYDQLFVKEPRMRDRTTWHNDQPYWPVRGWPTMSFWVALDRVDHQVSTLEFIRGSHTWNAWYQPIYGDEEGRMKTQPAARPGFIEMPDFEAERDRHEILSWDLEPGDVIAFHGLTLHGATGNTSGTEIRRAYSVRYAGGETWYVDSSSIPGHNRDLVNPALAPGDPLDSEMFPVVYLE